MQIDFKTNISAETAHIFVPVIIQSDESLVDRIKPFFDRDIHLAGVDQAVKLVREQKESIALAVPYHNGLVHFNLIPIDTVENYRQIKDKTRKVFKKHKLSLEMDRSNDLNRSNIWRWRLATGLLKVCLKMTKTTLYPKIPIDQYQYWCRFLRLSTRMMKGKVESWCQLNMKIRYPSW